MNFNEEQVKQVYTFMTKYNADETFKESVQQMYDEEVYQLSIMDIYALEEVLLYGNKEIYKKFMETKGEYNDSQAAELFDQFITLLADNEDFRQNKIDQWVSAPDTLSDMENFIFNLMYSEPEETEKEDEVIEVEAEIIDDNTSKDDFNNDRLKEFLENMERRKEENLRRVIEMFWQEQNKGPRR